MKFTYLTTLLVLQLLQASLLATPLVVVKTQHGYIVGTNGDITNTSNGQLMRHDCKPLLVGNFALIWEGFMTLGHKDKNHSYVPDVFFSRDFTDVLRKGGSFKNVKSEILRVTENDTRSFIKKNPTLYVPGKNSQDFVLAAFLPSGLQLEAFSFRETKSSHSPSTANFYHEDVSLVGEDVFCWYGGITHFEEWHIPDSKKTQEAGIAVATNGLNQIASIYKAGNLAGFDAPFVFVNVTPEKIWLTDPDHLCSK